MTLSDKILDEFHANKFSVRNGYTKVLDARDVKQFIKDVTECWVCTEGISRKLFKQLLTQINNLAGDELI